MSNMPLDLYIKQRLVISMMTIDLFYILDLILNLYSFILLLYDVSSFATLTMVLSLASDGQVNEFECNFDLQKNKQ